MNASGDSGSAADASPTGERLHQLPTGRRLRRGEGSSVRARGRIRRRARLHGRRRPPGRGQLRSGASRARRSLRCPARSHRAALGRDDGPTTQGPSTRRVDRLRAGRDRDGSGRGDGDPGPSGCPRWCGDARRPGVARVVEGLRRADGGLPRAPPMGRRVRALVSRIRELVADVGAPEPPTRCRRCRQPPRLHGSRQNRPSQPRFGRTDAVRADPVRTGRPGPDPVRNAGGDIGRAIRSAARSGPLRRHLPTDPPGQRGGPVPRAGGERQRRARRVGGWRRDAPGW